MLGRHPDCGTKTWTPFDRALDAKGGLPLIVLDHASRDVWGDIDGGRRLARVAQRRQARAYGVVG